MQRVLRTVLVLAICFALFAISSMAQVLNGTLVGTINDQTSAAVPGATVTIISESGVQRQATTNDSGGFSFAAVVTGTWEVTVPKEGF